MIYPLVELEIDIPARRHPGVNIPGDGKRKSVVFTPPPVKKLRLTEASEIALFGSLGAFRDYCMPPLEDVPFREALGQVTEEQAAIYNSRQDRLEDSLEKAMEHYVRPGVVKVRETDWDIELENI